MSAYPEQGFAVLEERPDWIMTISAYFDESGKFKDHDVVSFCGIASPGVQFQQNFAMDWIRCLNAAGIFCLSAKASFNPRIPLSKKNPALGVENRTAVLLP